MGRYGPASLFSNNIGKSSLHILNQNIFNGESLQQYTSISLRSCMSASDGPGLYPPSRYISASSVQKDTPSTQRVSKQKTSDQREGEETLKGGLRCQSPRWAAGRNWSPAAINQMNVSSLLQNKCRIPTAYRVALHWIFAAISWQILLNLARVRDAFLLCLVRLPFQQHM